LGGRLRTIEEIEIVTTIWITYAWADNKDSDVDFVVQELIRTGLTVKLDRWNIEAGKRLWQQIENFISNPEESDAWILYVTQNSLGSEACKEEYSYALDRALHQRGSTFPIIGLFPSTVDDSLIPAGVRTRLYVSITDPDWKERIKSSAEGRVPSIASPVIQPYTINIHKDDTRVVIEVRPRAGTWSPFIAAIPNTEKDRVNPRILHGPRGNIPHGGMLLGAGSGTSDDGVWHFRFAQNEATPTQSYFILCNELPSKLVFGVKNGQPQYMVERFEIK
jgi:hypothetical protein